MACSTASAFWKFPETEEDKHEIVKALHTYLEISESDEMDKVNGVIEHSGSYKNGTTAAMWSYNQVR